MINLPSRQVHLDFHTSEHILGVGSKFSKKQFQEALRTGWVNSITVFAKCHHGWSYYPTKIGKMHPALKIDLLGKQIVACHEIGVRAPIYYTVGWSANDAEDHPEWYVPNRDGSIHASGWDPNAKPGDPRPIGSWKFLCPSGSYLRHMLKQTTEICERYPVDGLFYDITSGPVCYCSTCLAAMKKKGYDPDNEAQAEAYNEKKWKQFMSESKRIIHAHHPEATVFYNGTTIMYSDSVSCPKYAAGMFDWNTHQELEDLPTTWGGYDKFPLRSKFFHRTGKSLLAMSGKFHTSWGEFGGFKYPEAIKFEAASMIAHGACCSFGDQLHPLGEMDMDTYRNIGVAYKYVRQIEGYGVPGRPVANLGLWLTGMEAYDQGVCNMLLERQVNFDIIAPEDDFSRYETIILTGNTCLSHEQARKLNSYASNGGGLLVLGESALDAEKKKFLLDVGATYEGPSRYRNDYLVAGKKLGKGLVRAPFLNYEAAIHVRAKKGTEVLAGIQEPYFDRTYEKYCSHQNTPYQPKTAKHPGALRKGNVIFLPHQIGAMYYKHGARVHRDIFTNALALIHKKPMVRTDMPSAGRLSFLHQPDKGRYVAHLLYGPPLQRGRCLVIEDLVPLYNVPVEVRMAEKIKKAYLIPGKKPLTLKKSRGAVKVVVPEVQCHCAVVFEY